MNAVEFLTELWGPQPEGRILLWELSTKRSRYLQHPTGATMIVPTDADVYTGVGLSAKDHGPRRRTPNAEIVGIAGLWADIDVNGGPDDKQGAAPDRDSAIELAESLAEPTLIVDSGYGIQAWWLFDGGPWRFKTYGDQKLAARAAAQWQHLLRNEASFGMDYTHDLARILRLPGTVNGKGGQRMPVGVLHEGPRHERDDLLVQAAEAGDVEYGYAIGDTPSVSVSCRPDAIPHELDRLLDRSPAMRRIWNHTRDDLPSMSEHDMALVSVGALAGWSDQELADLIVFHRKRRDPSDPKSQRLDYIQRTIQRARERDNHEGQRTSEPVKKDGSLTAKEWARVIETSLKATDDGAIELPFEDLTDAMDGGFRPGEVCLVAGWTSHGKSILVDQIADSAAQQGRKVHLYLTEMTAYQRGLRLLSRRARIPFSKLKRRELDTAAWSQIRAVLADLPYGVSIVSDWTVEDVVAHVRENSWDLVVVDLIHGFHYQDERDLSKTSSALMRAAKSSVTAEHPGTVVICAAHLNDGQMRDARSAVRPRPGLHSIKGSSSLKQDADTVIFVWREDDIDGAPTKDGAVWIAKCRDGDLEVVDVQLDTARMEFVKKAPEGAPW